MPNSPRYPSRSAADDALLARFAESRSPRLRDQAIARYMPLARSLAMRYRGGSESIDDLVQVASLGLIKAVDRFDPSRGKPFTGFAVPTILGELRRHFRDHVWNLRLPRGLQELTMKIDRAIEELTGDLGRSPSVKQIATRLEIDIDNVLSALEAREARRTLSLDAPSTDSHDSDARIDLIGRDDLGFDRVEAEFASRAANLDQRELAVLRMRTAGQLTQREIGRLLGVSQMQVSRIRRRALQELLATVRGDPSPAKADAS